MIGADAVHASRWGRRRRLGVVWLVLTGIFFLATAGNHFLFAYSRQYDVAAWLAALIMLPNFYLLLTKQEAARRNRKPIG